MSDYDDLLQAANDVLGRAQQALTTRQYAHVGFYAQKSVVNAIKALNAAIGEPASDETELAELLDWVPPAYQASLRDELRALDDYYVDTGNPNDVIADFITHTDAKNAIAWASETIDTVKNLALDL